MGTVKLLFIFEYPLPRVAAAFKSETSSTVTYRVIDSIQHIM